VLAFIYFKSKHYFEVIEESIQQALKSTYFITKIKKASIMEVLMALILQILALTDCSCDTHHLHLHMASNQHNEWLFPVVIHRAACLVASCTIITIHLLWHGANIFEYPFWW
jgi:hypothetical protein